MKNPFRNRWETIWKKSETFQKYTLGKTNGTMDGVVVLQKHLEKPNKFRAYIEIPGGNKTNISLDLLTVRHPETEKYLNEKG
jgi:hypothetical protein